MWFDRLFRDSEGHVIIAQLPNLPIMVWALAMLLKVAFATGRVRIALELISFGSLFTWAWEELFQGQSYFRRGLGLAVLVISIWWHIQQVTRLNDNPSIAIVEGIDESERTGENAG